MEALPERFGRSGAVIALDLRDEVVEMGEEAEAVWWGFTQRLLG
jgi:hypothetical protein